MRLTTTLFILALLFGCSATKNIGHTAKNPAIKSLKFLDEYIIPNNFHFRHTWVGGLSGIDYDAERDQYYLICDERSATSPSRYYTVSIKITGNKIDTVAFLRVDSLNQPNGQLYPSLKSSPQQAADPESIRYHKRTGTWFWSSEGARAKRNGTVVCRSPWVYQIDAKGRVLDSLTMPNSIKSYPRDYGIRTNEALEGLALSPDGKTLWASMEGPTYQDGMPATTKNGALLRFTQFSLATGNAVAQYAYPVDAVAQLPVPKAAFGINGVPELLAIGEKQFLVLERSFSTGIKDCTIKIYLADFAKADNVLEVSSLKSDESISVASKKLLLNLENLGIAIDNIEGITFGPKLPNGHASLLLVSDNNFADHEKTQILLFEVRP